MDVSALSPTAPTLSLVVSSDTAVSDVLKRVVDKFRVPDVSVDDLVLAEEPVRTRWRRAAGRQPCNAGLTIARYSDGGRSFFSPRGGSCGVGVHRAIAD